MTKPYNLHSLALVHYALEFVSLSRQFRFIVLQSLPPRAEPFLGEAVPKRVSVVFDLAAVGLVFVTNGPKSLFVATNFPIRSWHVFVHLLVPTT